MRRNGAHFALISVGKIGHQTLLLRLSPVLRNAVLKCKPLITPDHCSHKTTWPEFQPSLPLGHRISRPNCCSLRAVMAISSCNEYPVSCAISPTTTAGCRKKASCNACEGNPASSDCLCVSCGVESS